MVAVDLGARDNHADVHRAVTVAAVASPKRLRSRPRRRPRRGIGAGLCLKYGADACKPPVRLRVTRADGDACTFAHADGGARTAAGADTKADSNPRADARLPLLQQGLGWREKSGCSGRHKSAFYRKLLNFRGYKLGMAGVLVKFEARCV